MRMRKTIGLSLALLVVSATAMANQARPGHQEAAPSVKSKPAKTATASPKPSRKHHRASGTAAAVAARSALRHGGMTRLHAAPLPPPDQYVGPQQVVGLLQVVGRREIGSAAWYGGRHIGRLTASGERLDAVHATAAHRTLPLHSLVRVTNLGNGRSVIARITDRGPVSRSLVIDVSPRAAQELDMISAGIATVSIDPVVQAASAPP